MNPALKLREHPGRFRFGGPAFFATLLALGGHAFAQPATPPAAAEDSGDKQVVKLSPFVVSTDKDYGYAASNSIAGTRTNTPIKDIPINIQVFTKDLADDLLIKNQVAFESYNASLVNGSADRFSDNFIQQQYQAFLFRGFRQNWGLRDGIREYDPVDTQNLARVEVVKGPAAPLYGLAYPGGVMNNITKTVDFNKNFGSLRLTVGGEGDYRASLDANVTGKVAGNQKIGIRINDAYERTEDIRAHSEGEVKLVAATIEWQPFADTSAEFMMEQGYRSKPNGLGYFTSGEPDPAHPSLADPNHYFNNHATIPLQISNPSIPWDWNWSNGRNLRSLETHIYRGSLTQRIGDNFQVKGYLQYSDRLNIDGNGWNASGSDGVAGADSWESQGSGWDQANNRIISTYHYRDWGNKMHAYGATGVYTLDAFNTKNTFAFGGNAWGEKELSRAAGPYDATLGGFTPAAALQSAVYYPVQADINTDTIPNYLPSNLAPEVAGGPNGSGYHHEDNSNDYYFVNWQMSAFGDHLKTNLGFNHTRMKLLGWNTGVSTAPESTYEASKTSPLAGVVYEINKEVSVFGVYSTSLFPDTTKDSFGHQFSPQVGKSFEFGAKFEILNNKLSGTVSYFDIEQTGGTQTDPNAPNTNTVLWDSMTDAQRLGPPFNGVKPNSGDIIAGGKQESKGFDVDLVYQPIRQLQMVFSYEHVDHKFVTSAVPATIGQTYPFATKDRYSLLTKYIFIDGSAKGLALGLGISGGSKSLQDYQNNVARYEPARIVAEAFGSYRFKAFGFDQIVQLNIQNLLKTSDYTGWQATGSSSILATEMYKVPTPIVWRITYGVDF